MQKKQIAKIFAISILAVAILTISSLAASVSKYFTYGYATLYSFASYATASTWNISGNNYTYAKATIDYASGDWDISWDDGLGYASASVSKASGETIVYWSGTHAVRTAPQYNQGDSYSTTTGLSYY